jgi:hypothetical protein
MSLVSLIVSLFDASFKVMQKTKKATAKLTAASASIKFSFLNLISFAINFKIIIISAIDVTFPD